MLFQRKKLNLLVCSVTCAVSFVLGATGAVYFTSKSGRMTTHVTTSRSDGLPMIAVSMPAGPGYVTETFGPPTMAMTPLEWSMRTFDPSFPTIEARLGRDAGTAPFKALSITVDNWTDAGWSVSLNSMDISKDGFPDSWGLKLRCPDQKIDLVYLDRNMDGLWDFKADRQNEKRFVRLDREWIEVAEGTEEMFDEGVVVFLDDGTRTHLVFSEGRWIRSEPMK